MIIFISKPTSQKTEKDLSWLTFQQQYHHSRRQLTPVVQSCPSVDRLASYLLKCIASVIVEIEGLEATCKFGVSVVD